MSFDLLDAVLPAQGRYCVIGVGKYAAQSLHDTRDEVDRKVEELVQKQFDVYFGCAKYGPENNRTKDNAKFVRALWIDLDCGPQKVEEGKGYATQEEALAQLRGFCKKTSLPRPIIIDSGYGLHIYWLIEEVLDRRTWEPLSKRLRDLCNEHGLIVDPAVFDVSRVLRIPGTYNFKRSSSVEVAVLNAVADRIPYEELRSILGSPEPEPARPDFIPREMSPMMESLMANRIKRFKKIMMRSAEGDGCAQLVYCYQNQATLEEPLWRAALSIAAFCVDGRESAHKLSNQYPDYDEGEVEKKLDYIVSKGGPYTCGTFEKLNPNGCTGCPHKGNIKSPILLGIDVAEAESDDVEVEDEGVAVKYTIPEYPFPFFRGQHGGIYRKPTDEEDEPALIYEHDFYVVKRMHDAVAGEVVLFKLHLPRDGVKEFTVPMTSIVVKEKLREAIAHHGVVSTTKQMDGLLYYVTAFIKNLQFQEKAEVMRNQFGWVDKDSKFILGDKEITADGVFYSPPSTATSSVAAHMHGMGSLEKWKEVFNMYSLPGMEPHAFAALTAFGSPLLKFTGLEGAIINVIYPRSGSGKSTTLYMCNSVVGHPKKLGAIWKDTMNTKMHMLGVMNNLANTIDEITNMSSADFSDLAYSISQGRGKNRMKSQSNEMRINNTTWQGITLCSANASFYEKLGEAKDSPDGEMMRLLEYKIAPNSAIDVALGKEMFDHQLFENYGHAGETYAQWLVNNLEDAKDLLRKVQARIDKQVQFTSRERFWSGVCACNIAGGLIAKSLGLHDYDMRRVYDWMIGMLGEMREDVKPPEVSPVAILGDFINTYLGNALVVNGDVDARNSLAPLPTQEPRGELLIRFEPDTKDLYITAKSFKNHCVKRQTNYKDTIAQLEKLGVYIESLNKRMGKGMKIVSPAVRALRFNTANFEIIQVDQHLPKPEDEDRVSDVPA
jgi:hypothetical protein